MFRNKSVSLVGRQADVEALSALLRGNSFLMFGMRRVGKSTLLDHLCAEPPAGVVAVRVDLEGLVSEVEAVARIGETLRRRGLLPAETLKTFSEELGRWRKVGVAGLVQLEREGAQPADPRMRHIFEDEGHAHLARRYGEQHAAVRAILTAAAHEPEGVLHHHLVGAALAKKLASREEANELVFQLIDEFYLDSDGKTARFVNPLFRQWWLRFGVPR